jgi:hypothetical protein
MGNMPFFGSINYKSSDKQMLLVLPIGIMRQDFISSLE